MEQPQDTNDAAGAQSRAGEAGANLTVGLCPKQATPTGTLLEQLMNPNISKSEREWAAVAEIERLRGRLDVALEICRQWEPDNASPELRRALVNARA